MIYLDKFGSEIVPDSMLINTWRGLGSNELNIPIYEDEEIIAFDNQAGRFDIIEYDVDVTKSYVYFKDLEII